jgi:hypothetical protein
MCPDRQILSLYLDGELPSPWKEKMEAHLASCQECRARLGQYQKLSAVLEEDRIKASPDVQSRVWSKIAAQKPAQYYPAANNRIWRRSVSLPVPLAAAAAAVFAVVLFLAVQGMQFSGVNSAPDQGYGAYSISASMDDSEEMLSMSDMNSVLQYLSRQESSDFMFIDLPETRNFSSYGEPALLRASDYSRGRQHR